MTRWTYSPAMGSQEWLGHTYFNVIGLRRRRSHVACAQCHYPVMQAEFLQNFFSIEREPFMLVVGIFGPRKLHQFDFLKLMLTNDAAHVLAIRPRFAAKAGSVSRERNRKPRRVKDLVAVQVRDRDFRR